MKKETMQVGVLSGDRTPVYVTMPETADEVRKMCRNDLAFDLLVVQAARMAIQMKLNRMDRQGHLPHDVQGASFNTERSPDNPDYRYLVTTLEV